MFVSQRTTTNSIRFVFTLFIARSQSQTIDKVQGGGTLSVSHDFGFEIGSVVFSDLVDMFLESTLVWRKKSKK